MTYSKSSLWVCFSFLLVYCHAQNRVIREERVDVGTHELHAHCVGEGSLTIVLDVGIGDIVTVLSR
jgi:hypothetical protein